MHLEIKPLLFIDFYHDFNFVGVEKICLVENRIPLLSTRHSEGWKLASRTSARTLLTSNGFYLGTLLISPTYRETAFAFQ